MGIEQLRIKQAQADDRMKAVLQAVTNEDRVQLTEEEQSQYDAAKADYEAAGSLIEKLQEAQKRDAELSAPEPTVAGGRNFGVPSAPEAVKEFENVGEFLHSVAFNQNDQRLEYQSEHTAGEGSKGGFMLPKQFRTELLKVDPAKAVIRPRATVIPAGSPADAEITMPALDQTGDIYAGVSVSFEDEEKDANFPESDAAFREISLTPKSIIGSMKATHKLLRNWQAASAVLMGLMQDAVTHLEEKRFMFGNGSKCPLGIAHANNAAALLTNRAGANAISYADLAALEANALTDNVVWIASPKVKTQLRQLKDAANQLIYVDAREGLPATLMGYPVIFDRRMPALGSKGDIGLYDLSKYLIKDGSGPLFDISEHAEFKKARTVFRVIQNVDGQPWLKAPITGEDGSSTYSPFCILDVPA